MFIIIFCIFNFLLTLNILLIFMIIFLLFLVLFGNRILLLINRFLIILLWLLFNHFYLVLFLFISLRDFLNICKLRHFIKHRHIWNIFSSRFHLQTKYQFSLVYKENVDYKAKYHFSKESGQVTLRGEQCDKHIFCFGVIWI